MEEKKKIFQATQCPVHHIIVIIVCLPVQYSTGKS